MGCCEQDFGTWRSIMVFCEGIWEHSFVINDREYVANIERL